MRIVILGCGRVGARMAELMEADGHHVSIIDSELEAFERLPETFAGDKTLGHGIDADVLKAAGIANADAFAAVTNYDNTNIMACQVAKEIFGVRHVLARIYDPGRETLYKELGLETICPTTLISTTARDILLDQIARDDGKVTATPIGVQINPSPATISANTPEATAAIASNVTEASAVPPPQIQGSGLPAADAAPERGQPERNPGNGRGFRNLFRTKE